MTDTQSELQPDTGEVLQEEPQRYTAIPVCVEDVQGPVRVQSLPRKAGSTRTRTVGATRVVQVLEADPRRASALLMSVDQAMYVAFSEAAAQDPSTMSLWPAGIPFPVTAVVDVYVLCAVDAQTTQVSVTTELWAAG